MIKDPFKWNTRASALYALGMWTVVGSFAYFKYTGVFDGVPEPAEEVDDPKDPYKFVYKSEHFKSVTVYKKDFVPYPTRIYNFIKSFRGEPGEPGEQGK